MVQQKMGKGDAATKDLRQVVQLQPNSAEAHLNLGIALADSYHFDEALVEFSSAERLAPGVAAPRYNRGRVLVDLKRYDEAGPELAEACRLAPKYPAPLYLLALADNRTGKYDDAVQALNKLIALEPRNANALFLLGQALQKLGKTREAMSAWERAADLDATQTEAMYNLWRASMKMSPERAKAYRERFEAMQRQKQLTTQAETLANFGLASANRGDYAQAISQLREAIEQCGNCASKPDMYKDLELIECKSGNRKSCENLGPPMDVNKRK
jgi:tetratricopeptide (TPR) repeat protein